MAILAAIKNMFTATPENEQTKNQSPMSFKNSGAAVLGVNTDAAAPLGTIKTYRRMRKNPTVALARMLVRAPVIASGFSVVGVDGVPQDRIDFVITQMNRVYSELISDMLLAVEYGFQSFGKVWGFEGNG